MKKKLSHNLNITAYYIICHEYKHIRALGLQCFKTLFFSVLVKYTSCINLFLNNEINLTHCISLLVVFFFFLVLVEITAIILILIFLAHILCSTATCINSCFNGSNIFYWFSLSQIKLILDVERHKR